MPDPLREKFECEHCNRPVWLFGGEPFGTACPHCGYPIGSLSTLPEGMLESLVWDLTDAQSIDLSTVIPRPQVLALVAETLARSMTVFPVDMDSGSLTLAVPDTIDLEVLDKLRFVLNQDISLVVSSRSVIVDAIDRCYN